MTETAAEYKTKPSEVVTFEVFFTDILYQSGIRRNGDWREYERGKAIARNVCQSDAEYNEAVQIVVDWVGV